MEPPHLHIDLELPRRRFPVQLSLEVGRETLALVGPSGAGKSTVLRAVAGLERPRRGRIALGDRVWCDSDRRVHLPPERRSVGMVFQDHALFPHLSVLGNVRFAGREGAEDALRLLGIAHLADARPGSISGGEAQRVALARALARRPDVLLLDEPMAALDPHTRATVRAELRTLLRTLGIPTIMVSHDFQDAAVLADRVAVMVDGRVVQTGTPSELVGRPADPFVATLTGAGLLTGEATPDATGLTRVRLDDGTVVQSTDVLEGLVGVAVQPREVTVARAVGRDSRRNHLEGTVTAVVRLGNVTRVTVGPLTAEITTASADAMGLAEGQRAVAQFKATGTRLMPLPRDEP